MTNIQTIKQRFGIIGTAPMLDRALDTAIRVANTDLTVLITGESGTGKEVFSKIIHSLSPRKHNNFIAVNCGAIPAGTINSELFGHEKGAFTGATSDRKGYFETVDTGTIFLDEIGEMPLDTQSFLLRVLESGEFMRVGSSKVSTTDVRVVAATNINLLESVRTGKFREDLYYRLNTVPIALPPLRERHEDINLLFRKFASDFGEKYRIQPIRLDAAAKQLIEKYAWPGNIRELRNIVEQISILSEDRDMSAEQLLQYLPKIGQRNLPAIHGQHSENDFQEREILYKLLFDMKADLNDLKSLVFELIRSNNLHLPAGQLMNHFPQLASGNDIPADSTVNKFYPEDHHFGSAPERSFDHSGGSIIVNDANTGNRYNSAEVVDENLSLAENEKGLIRKALKKHGNRRKDAAEDLGISERTLYRKIKEYDL